MIRDICRLVEIPSVNETGSTYLFGENIDRCLDTALDIMRELGFSVHKAPDGAYAYAEIGEGPLFGVLGHMDVVKARLEDGWEHNPFQPVIKDGFLSGRGVQDDKGPMMAAAYAVKALIDEGCTFDHRVRFIFGSDEETLWRGIRLYTEREEIPEAGFTPDSTFPLTYAEKGLLQVLVRSSAPAAFAYRGGDGFNSVSPRAFCKENSAIASVLEKKGYPFRLEAGEIMTEGITAHAKNPWKGSSANLHLLEAVREAGLDDAAVRFVCDNLNGKFRFEGFSDEDLSDFSGPVTINLGKMQADAAGTVFSVDLRLPVGCPKEKVLSLLRAKAALYDLTVEEFDWLNPIHVPLDSPLVQKLLSSYREVTGDTQTAPYISAGATYARAINNCVAFGANIPSAPTSEHQPNERVRIGNLLLAAEVYKEAFRKCVTR